MHEDGRMDRRIQLPRMGCHGGRACNDAYENGLTRPLYISRRILARDRR